MKTFTLCFFSLLFFLFSYATVSAAVITVTNTNDNGAGSLREAISSAAAGDEIVFSSSINGSIIYLDSMLVIDKALSITGNGMENTIIDGDQKDRVIMITSGNHVVNISDMIIQNGRVVQNNAVAGGISANAIVTFTNCWIRGNTVFYNLVDSETYGGGIYCRNSTTFINCIVSGNSSLSRGGGIYCPSGDLTLINTTIAGNESYNWTTATGVPINSRGGGIYFSGGSFYTLEMRNSVVWANESIYDEQVFGNIDLGSNSIVQDMDLTSQGPGNLDGTDPANDPNFIIGYKVNIPNTGGDYRIMANSNLIDAGNNAHNSTSSDIFGVDRTFDGDLNGTATIDIGAVEFNNYPGLFITQWDTRNPGTSADNQITIPTFGFISYNYTVHWGDGTSTTTTSSSPLTHTYGFAPQLPIYNVVIEGSFPRILFNGGGDKDKLLAVLNWGDNPWTSMRSAFKGCTNLTIETPWSPNLSVATNLFEMFQDATSVNENFENWNVSNITNMGLMFDGATSFNGNIGDWDVSNVHTFSAMFRNATSFNRDIGNWNPESGIGMGSMFQGATAFNRYIGNWDVGNVETFTYMFDGATNFNQNLANWDVSSGSTFAYMFRNATSFDRDLGNWDISGINQAYVPPASIAECKGMFEGTSLSIANYDNLLIGWNRLDPGESSIPLGVEFHGGSSQYCAGEGAHMNLENNRLWTFTDGGSLVSYDTLDIETCSAYTVPSGDETYTMSGSYVDTIPNAAGCDSILTINLTVDVEPPIANCMDITVSLDTNGMYTLTPQEIDNGSFDSCSAVSLSVDPGNLDCADVGSNSVNLIVTDENGNSSTCTANVEVVDDISPTPICQDISIGLDGNGVATIQASDIDNGSFDNCMIATMDIDITSFDCGDIGVQIITFIVVDDSGNSASCMANVTIEDVIAPTVSCGPDVTLNSSTSGAGDCMGNAGYYGSYTVDDNCPDLIQTREVFTNELGDTLRDQIFNLSAGSVTPFFAWPVGINTATIIPTDASGNEGSACSYQVTVLDDEAPIANCQDITVQLNEEGEVDLNQYSIGNVNGRLPLQNSGGSNLTNDCDCPTGFVAVGYEGFAGCIVDEFRLICKELLPDGSLGNTTAVTCFSSGGSSVDETHVLTGNDVLVGFEVRDVDYSFASARVLSEVKGIGKSLSQITDIEDNSSLNTMLSSITGSGCYSSNEQTSTEYAPAGHVIVGMSVTIAGGYTPSVRFRYAPVTNTLGVENGSTDNCGISNATLTPSNFDCEDVGGQSAVYSVWDRFGNSNTCNVVVTVEDNIPPVATCQDATIFLDVNGEAVITALDIDNGSTDACGIDTISLDKTSFDCSETGQNTVVLTVTDVHGNTSGCTAMVTVLDNLSPMAVCQDITVNLDANGEVTVPAMDVDGGSTDNCGIANRTLDQNTFDCNDLGSNTVVLTVTDQRGNSSTCTATITVEDNIPATVICQDVTISLDENGEGTITVNDIDGGTTDNCGIANMSLDTTTFDCSDIGDNSVTLTVVEENGDSSFCVATVTVVDDMPPTLVCQDVTVYLNESGTGPLNPFITGAFVSRSDNCGMPSHIVGQVIGVNCSNIGDNTLFIRQPDLNGNSSPNCYYTLTIVDAISPMAVCQDITVSLDANGEVSVPAMDVDGGSTDNCEVTDFNLDQSSFDCGDLGSNSVVLTVTDQSGNSSTCTATITVEDNVLPTPICQDVTISLDNNGNASLMATEVDGGSFDNCSISSISINRQNFSCADLGDQTVVLTVMDQSENSASCNATVTVEDNIAPTVSCSGDVNFNTSSNGSGDCTGFVGFTGSYTLDDNCPGFIQAREIFVNELGDTLRNIVFDQNANTWFPNAMWPAGTNTATIIPIDGSGNEGTACSYQVTVIDDEAPVANCQDITVQLNEQGEVDLNQYSIGEVNGRLPLQNSGDPNLTTECDCPEDYVAVGYEGFAGCIVDEFRLICKELMPDGSLGNTTAVTCFSSGGSSVDETHELTGDEVLVGFEVSDVDYSFAGARILSEVKGIGKSLSQIVNVEGNSTQNTMLSSIAGSGCFSSNEQTSTEYAPAGHVIVGMSVTGAGGYTPSVRFRYAPVTNTLGVDNGSTDNCGITNATLSPSDFDCGDVGGNTAVYTVWDRFGNSSTCSAVITVEDNVLPVAMCQDATIFLDENGAAVITAMHIDNGSTDTCGIDDISLDQTSFDCTETGQNTVVLTVTDVNGNTATCNATVTVLDTILPMASCQDITVQLDANGEGSIVPSDVDNGSFDNCEVSSLALDKTDFDCSEVGPNSVILTVTDESGNTSSCTAMVTVEDNVPPTPICQDVTVQLDANGEGSIVPEDIDNGSFDNCGVASLALDEMDFDCSEVGENTVELTVTDVNGNTASCNAIVTVEDNIPPTPICRDVTVQLDNNGEGSIVPSDVDNGSFDNCEVESLALDEMDFDCSETGQNTVVLTVTDVNGNSASCSATVTVEDNIPPVVLSVPADITLECDLPIPGHEPVAEDNCGVIITHQDEIIPGRCTGEYVVRRTFTIVDPSGNEASFKPVREIQFIDTKVPYLISAPSDETLACGTTPTLTLPVVEDNCDPAPDISWEDTYVEDPSCPQGGRIDRVFTISDDCGNSYELLQQFYFFDDEDPVIEAVHPDLVNVPNGGTIQYQCYAQEPNWELIEFDLDDFAFSDNCSQDINQNLTETVLGNGDCRGDGYLAKTHYTITADDGCGNTSSFEFYVELVDEVAPVLEGVPQDISITCTEAYTYPLIGNCLEEGDVYATDECECAEVTEVRDTIGGGCDHEYSVIVTYLATDNCGNSATSSYTITVEDNSAPQVYSTIPELEGMSSGSSLDINCNGAHFPIWAQNIGPETFKASDNCGQSELVDFSEEIVGYEDCFDRGAMASLTYKWWFEDECGNEMVHEVELRLVDTSAPVIVLAQSTVCDNQGVVNPEVRDNCGEVRSLDYRDEQIIDACSGEVVIERTWTAIDHCGNIGTAVQTVIEDQTMTYGFTAEPLVGAADGDTIAIECGLLEKLQPGEDWISLQNECFKGGEVLSFEENRGEMDTLCTQGVLRIDEWIWTVRTLCNEVTDIHIFVQVEDRTVPTLVDFEGEIELACGEERPLYAAKDICSPEKRVEEVSFEWVQGDSCERQLYERVLMAGDMCGNERMYTQTVIIDASQGPEISGVPVSVCHENELESVRAFDHCSNSEVPVIFNDVMTERCGEGSRTLRVYSAESLCGSESLDSVYIIENDEVAPDYEMVGSTLEGLENGSIVEVQCDGNNRLRDMDFQENDIVFSDACDPDLKVSFSDRIERGNCNVDGYREKRILEWSATDVCGNTAEVRIEFRLVDTEAPQFGFVEREVWVSCGEQGDIDEVIAFDNCSGAVELTYEDGMPRSTERGTEIDRTWTAIDGCGNTNTITQTIIYDSEGIECLILQPKIVSCDDNSRISAEVSGGTGPYTYNWVITEGYGDILQGQGTASILLNVAFSNTELTLVVQDQNGCISSCSIDIICFLKPDRDITRESEKRAYHLYQNTPNPFMDVTTIGFTLPENGDAVIQIYSAEGKQVHQVKGSYKAGYNEVEVRRDALPASGMYYYELRSGDFKGVKRMIILE